MSGCTAKAARRSTGSIDAAGERDDEDRDADLERLKDLASEAPVIRLVNALVSRAVELHASDIHLECGESRLRLRYRIDGVLRDLEPPPARLKSAIISRLKIMAKLNIAERRLAQDGRIRLAVRGKEIDFRVSTTPTIHGESVVLRILDRGVSRPRFRRRSASRNICCGRSARCSSARTASCSSPARPAAARRRRSTPR